jgi:large subunit ribosomal protein L15
MDLHSLRNEVGARKTAKRRGRGRSSGLGKTAGRGNKGQFARKGHKHKDSFEGGQMPTLRRLPKRGFKNPARCPFFGVNVASLQDNFPAGSEVTPEALVEAGLADGCRVKILGTGDITSALTVKAHAFSASAKAKIEAAGGKCEVI